MNPGAVIDQTADSESDVPASPGQWPASPERDQLPPDSSLESGECSDQSVQKTVNNPRSASSSQRQSQPSILSHSMPSGRHSPISARHFPRESESPSLESPDLLSPSTGSLDTFKCPMKDCRKSCAGPDGLKYHIEVRCPVIGCLSKADFYSVTMMALQYH